MKRGHIPIRTCRGCGGKAPKQELNRFVVERGCLVENRASGYGYYCCQDAKCRTKIEKKFKRQKKVRADKEFERE